MSLDLLALLSGERPTDDERPDPADVVSRLRCSCGTVVGLLARSGGESWLWRAPYRHTARGAAEIVLDAALEDFEALAAADDADALAVAGMFEPDDTIEALAAALPPLRMPARLRKVTGLARLMAEHDAERDRRVADESAARGLPAPTLAPSRPAYTEAGCGKCRRVLHLGTIVMQLEAEPAPPREVVVTEPPPLGVVSMGYDWPDSARPSRVALYRSLSDVLESQRTPRVGSRRT